MASRDDTDARLAAFGERVEGQGRRLSSLEQTVTTGFRQIEGSISALSTEYRNGQRPQWQAMGVILSAMIVLIGLLYWPVREQQADTKSDIAALSQTMKEDIAKAENTLKQDISEIAKGALSVQSFLDFKSGYENNRVVSRQDLNDRFQSVSMTIDKVRDDLVPRKELDRVWLSYDTQLSNERETRTTSDANIQRQLDEIKQATASVYGQRDALMELRDSQKQLREDLARIERERNRTPP